MLTSQHIHLEFVRCSNTKRIEVIQVHKDRDQTVMQADTAGAFISQPYSFSFQLPCHSTCICAWVHMSVDSYQTKVIFLRGKVIRISRVTEDGGGITFKSCGVQGTQCTAVCTPSQLTLFCFSKHSDSRLCSNEHSVLHKVTFPACWTMLKSFQLWI